MSTPISSTAQASGPASKAGTSTGTGTTGATQTGPAGQTTTGTSQAGSSTGSGVSATTTTTIDHRPTDLPVTLAVARGWSSAQTIIVLVVLGLLALLLVPGILVRRRLRRGER